MSKIVLEYIRGKTGRKVERVTLAKIEVPEEVSQVAFDMTQEELQAVQEELKRKCETIFLYIGERKSEEEIKEMYYGKE